MSEVFQDEEIYPALQSASGANAFYLADCSVVENRPAYASCLKKIVDRADGRLSSIYSDCSAAIGKKACPAQKMKQEEIARGQAMFYINRAKLQSFSQYREEMTVARQASGAKYIAPARSKFVTPPAAAKPPAMQIMSDVGSYADAINAAMKESVPVIVAKQEPQESMSGGLSLIEMARIQMNKKTN